jgi:membrane-associated phospholipid phosphatase
VNAARAFSNAAQRWVWPLLLLLVSAPWWLHSAEPATFFFLNGLCAAVAAPVWTGLSLLGNGWGVLGVTAPLLVLAPRLMWAWLCAAPFAIAFARTGKYFIVSDRPAEVLDHARMRIVGDALNSVSMPSGHTVTAFAVASGLYFALPQPRRTRHLWLFLLAGGTGLSRIAVGAHWPGDVAVGASLGLVSGILGNALLQRLPPAFLRPSGVAQRLLALLLALAAYTLFTEQMDFAENALAQRVLGTLLLGTLAVFVWRNWRNWRDRGSA